MEYQKGSVMHLIHGTQTQDNIFKKVDIGTSLLSTPLPLWTSIITLGKKMMTKNIAF